MPPKTGSARPAEDAPEFIPAVPAAEAKTDAEQARLSRIDQMRDHLRAQKKYRIKITNSDEDVPVQINGYTVIVQKGVAVDVPEDVAWHLENAGYIDIGLTS